MDINVEYVLAACKWLQRHPAVLPLPLMIYCISKGSELAFITANLAHKNLIGSIVVTGTQAFLTEPSFFFGGLRIENFAKMKLDLIEEDSGGLVIFNCFSHNEITDSQHILPVDNLHNLHFLFLCGGDDRNFPVLSNATILAKRLMKTNHVTIITYPGTGHLLEPPAPHCHEATSSLFAGAILRFGGDDVASHARGRLRAWDDLLRFVEEMGKISHKL